MDNILKPIEEPFSSQISTILEKYPQQGGYILKLFRVFANSIRFLKKGTVNLLDSESPITLRQREIVILRVCANNNCEYEWGVHVSVFSERAGLNESQVAATRLEDHKASCWNEEDCLLIKAVDELCSNGGILPDTYEQFKDVWSLEQQLEILALAGNYHTVSFVANTSQLESESFAAKFPTK